MDQVEALVATKRISKWPMEWRQFMLDLPASEALVVMELVALLDARPAGEERR